MFRPFHEHYCYWLRSWCLHALLNQLMPLYFATTRPWSGAAIASMSSLLNAQFSVFLQKFHTCVTTINLCAEFVVCVPLLVYVCVCVCGWVCGCVCHSLLVRPVDVHLLPSPLTPKQPFLLLWTLQKILPKQCCRR